MPNDRPIRVEVITGVAGRRYWPAQEKLRIVEGEENQGSVRWTETPTNGARRVRLGRRPAQRRRPEPAVPLA
jgi:hypothetical protein